MQPVTEGITNAILADDTWFWCGWWVFVLLSVLLVALILLYPTNKRLNRKYLKQVSLMSPKGTKPKNWKVRV